MKEKPILFSGPMVRAILEGRKTQTRRVAKRDVRLEYGDAVIDDGSGAFYHPTDAEAKCPYPVGTVMWVRETHKIWFPTAPNGEPQGDGWKARYRADNDERWTGCGWDEGPDYLSPEDAGVNMEPVKWRPSIFMPRWACRLRAVVTKVRVERVQDISVGDAFAEGAVQHERGDGPWDDPHVVTAFRDDIWEPLYAKNPGCSWADNPFVWAYDFERSNP